MKKKLKVSKLNVCVIAKKDIGMGVLVELDEMEAFNHADKGLNERMFAGDIFGNILENEEQLPNQEKAPKYIIEELKMLDKRLNKYDYVLVTDITE
jgi:hypothetical protein